VDSKNFAIIGVGGFVAPRHLRAIKETGHRTIAALDPNDSVGLLDQFSHEISFFKEFERFDRHCEKLRRRSEAEAVHYVSICSPNFLHDAHVRFALRLGADAICEKPLVLNPWNLEALQQLEQETGRKVNTILQLRLHPALIALRERLLAAPRGEKHQVQLTYITSRGLWYLYSWKGDIERSGGLATNIGIHFFDLLQWLFGAVEFQEVHLSDARTCAGYLEHERAKVRWMLSIDRNRLPEAVRAEGKPTFRSISIDGEEVEFSEGFTDLHTASYREILNGRGFGLDDARTSIKLAHSIRNSAPTGGGENSHSFLRGER